MTWPVRKAATHGVQRYGWSIVTSRGQGLKADPNKKASWYSGASMRNAKQTEYSCIESMHMFHGRCDAVLNHTHIQYTDTVPYGLFNNVSRSKPKHPVCHTYFKPQNGKNTEKRHTTSCKLPFLCIYNYNLYHFIQFLSFYPSYRLQAPVGFDQFPSFRGRPHLQSKDLPC
jgi:hypothetical protein